MAVLLLLQQLYSCYHLCLPNLRAVRSAVKPSTGGHEQANGRVMYSHWCTHLGLSARNVQGDEAHCT